MRSQIVLLSLVGMLLAEQSVTLNMGSSGHCSKYMEDTTYLQVAGIKLIELDNQKMITRVIPCKMLKQASAKQVIGNCKSSSAWDRNAVKLIISVRINNKDSKYVTNDIEYRYNEKVMKMKEYGTYDPIKVQDKPFHHSAHLFVNEIKINDGKAVKNIKPKDCFTAWPNFMIADHGLYTFVSDTKGLARVYFDPYVPGEYFLSE